MPAYKLSYFNGRGRAEAARLLFAASGTKFDDERIEGEQWPEFKPKTPYGQMPVLSVDGKMLHQSNAIIRFLARELGLYGKDNMENTKADIVIETVNDVFTEMVKCFFEKDESKKKEMLKNMQENTLPKFLKFIQSMLKDNGGDFLVGKAMTVADIAVFDLLDKLTTNPDFGKDILKDFKIVQGAFDKIKDNANIKKYLTSRPDTSF